LLQAADLQSVLLVPLTRQDRFLGLLGMGQKTAVRTFTEHELRLTKNLANQAAVAIEHANLFRQAQRRIQELSTFQDIVLQLNTPLKLSEVLATITQSALKLVDASNMHIYLYNPDSDAFTFGAALWQDGRREPAVPAPRKEGLTMAVVHKGEPIVINDASSHPLFLSEKSHSWGICSIAGFPLRHGDQVIGAFTATFLHPHTFSDDEQLLLSLLADQAAVAVRNAGLFTGSQRRLRDMAALVDMAKQVTGNLKLRSVLQTTVQTIKGLLGSRASTITMLSENATELVVVAAAGADPKAVDKARMKLGEGVSGQVVRTAERVYIRDAHSEPDFLFFDEVVRSLLVVPLIIRDRAIGTMTVDSAQPNAFSESDIQLMTIAAAQVSVAIANARLFEELEERAAELAAAYEELKESDRLKDELVQNVSHELRTPLTFVKGYVDLLMEGEMGLVTPRQQEALLIVAEKTDEITRLIEDIITLQRIDSGNLQLENVSLGEIVRTAVASHSLVVDKKGMRIVSEMPADIVDSVMIDKQRINQVLDNIIGNALKFSPDGGVITVTLFEENEMVGVAVSDQGIGVPQDKRERIFERFYQIDGSARRRFGGTGVGLAIVKRIVDAHQGRIWVESEVGEGSTFFITLPKAAK
ncbi:MAG: GAF domain-containing protein, partial [Anaerolineae bacterium]